MIKIKTKRKMKNPCLPSMASSTVTEVAVFIDTSLSTHIAMSVSPDVTVSELKRRLESVHSKMFPQMGNIKVNGLMVRRKSYFYHLPESLPIKHVFHGFRGTWFLFMEADPSERMTTYKVGLNGCLSVKENCTERKTKRRKDLSSPSPVVEKVSTVAHLSKRRKIDIKKKKKSEHRQESASEEPPSKMLSESVSVSGIIKKYFSVDEDVTSPVTNGYSSKARTDKMTVYAPKTPPILTSLRASRVEQKITGVGKRIIVAANNLRISKTEPIISLRKYSNEKLSGCNAKSLIRNLVFEMNNGEE